ncbi:hypothetical protein C8J57DRAFT_1726924 [Mycena rebaudengoi]|nr:hypothetical protein C8J57DRAFT_1726924 [Mycena rebaudengoi]
MDDDPMPYWRDERQDEQRKNTQKRTPAPSPQPSRSTTPAPSNRRGLSPSATGILPFNPNSTLRGVDKGADSLKGGNTVKADKSDTVQSMPVRATYNMSVHGGTGGHGGTGEVHGGHGGTGEGTKFDIRDSNVTLTDPHATKIRFIKEKLANHIAARHEYTDQSKSLCAPGTRVQIQADILKWLSPQPGTNERIFWITGIAGSGKSTLSATLVKNLCEKQTPVAAQFFISRNIPETVDPSKIIPTIAQQLAEFSPTAANIIYDVLQDRFPSSRKEQVQALLLAPIRELSKSHNVVVIVIDALDELQDAAMSVVEILSTIAPRDCDLPDNVQFLITSRPEHWADISRSKTLELAVFKQRALCTESSREEVHNFIFARMKQITRWNDWPSDSQVQYLSDKANGLFHYAATVLQWIEGQIFQYGTASRKRVFGKFTQMGIGQLEDLYRLILTSFENIDGPHVIGTILVLDEPLTIRQIIALLADIPEDDFDVANFLQRFRSVLIPGTTTLFEEATPQMHKSFRDYIMDVHAPAEFRILKGHAHFITARSCLEVIVKAGSQSDAVVKYCVEHWYQHLRKAVEGSITWEDERMWNLFEQMVEEAVIGIWAATSLRSLFMDVAAAGWGLLKEVLCAFPPSPMFVLLTFSCLLASRKKCVLFPITHVCLSCSLFLAFLSLGRSAACFSPIAHICLSCSLILTFLSLERSACFSPSPMCVLLTFSRLLVSRKKCVLSPLPMFVLLTFSRLLVSRKQCAVCAFPPLPMFVLLTFSCLLVSRDVCFPSIAHEVRAFPPLPMFVLLTWSRLLVSSWKCVLFPHRPCLLVLLTFSRLLVSSFMFYVQSACFPPSPMFVLLTFSHLLVSRKKCEVRRACFSPSPMFVCLAHFFSPSCLQRIVRPSIPFIKTHITFSA